MSSADYLASVRDLVVVVPITTGRITRRGGAAGAETMREVDRWLQDFLGIGR